MPFRVAARVDVVLEGGVPAQELLRRELPILSVVPFVPPAKHIAECVLLAGDVTCSQIDAEFVADVGELKVQLTQ